MVDSVALSQAGRTYIRNVAFVTVTSWHSFVSSFVVSGKSVAAVFCRFECVSKKMSGRTHRQPPAAAAVKIGDQNWISSRISEGTFRPPAGEPVIATDFASFSERN
jgi:hypothetical protein